MDLNIRLDEYCESVRDGTHDTPNPQPEGFPLVTSKAIKNNKIDFESCYFISENDYDKINKRSKVDKWDVLMTMIGTVGRLLLVQDNPNYAIKNIALFKVNDEHRAKWLYYYLSTKTVQDYFEMIASGTSQHFIGLGHLRKLKINDFHNNSSKIVDVLSSYDDLIENNNKRIKILEQMAENLYKKLFAYKKINDTACIVRLKEMIKIVRGLSYSTEEIEVDAGNNLVNLKNIQSFGGFRRDGTKLYSGKYKDEQIVRCGDLVMGVTDMTQDRRTVGSVALIPKINGVSVISADLIKIDSQIDNSFLYAMFKHGNVSKYISQFANGANVLHLRPQAVLNIKITLPPQDMIDRYVKFVKPLFEEIENLNQHNENLVKQRDMLLPRLMSGKLEIKKSQKKVIEFKPKKTFIEFKNSFAAAARKDSGLTEQDMEELYKAYCDDSRDE